MQVNTKAVNNCEMNYCDSCESEKGCCQTNKINTTKKFPINIKELKNDHLLYGKIVYKIIIY